MSPPLCANNCGREVLEPGLCEYCSGRMEPLHTTLERQLDSLHRQAEGVRQAEFYERIGRVLDRVAPTAAKRAAELLEKRRKP